MSFDIDSSFEGDSDVEKRRRRRADLAGPTNTSTELHGSRGPPGSVVFDVEHRRSEGAIARYHSASLNAYDRHKLLINTYVLSVPGAKLARDTSRDRTDWDVLRQHHRFLWTPSDLAEDTDSALSWQKRLAKRYYDKLFKEYCVCDLTYYKLNKVALRWRTDKEVVEGKGQFRCGDKHCHDTSGLRSWEVNFCYVEHGESRSCLVKLRLCAGCSRKLNHRHRRKEVTRGRSRACKRQKEVSNERSHSSKKRKRSSGSSDEKVDSGNRSVPAEPEPAKQDCASPQAASTDIWRQPAPVTEQKTTEQEMDEFLSELFL